MIYLEVFIICLVVIGAAAAPSIYLDSPKHGATFLLKMGANSQSIPLEYQLFGLDSSDQYELCFEIYSISNDMKNVVENACIPIDNNRLTINNLSEGQYQLHAWLKSLKRGLDMLQSTKITNAFQIYSYESAVPRINLHPKDIQVRSDGQFHLVADVKKRTADLTLGYSYSASPLDPSLFTLCAYIVDLNSQSQKLKLPLTCLSAKDRQLMLNNLGVGDLELHLILRDVRNNNQLDSLIKASELIRIVHVKDLDQSLPNLQVLNPLQEYVEDPSTHTATVEINFQFQGDQYAIQQVVICVVIELITHNHTAELKSVVVPFSCLPPNNNVLTLQNMKVGEYSAMLMLARADRSTDVRYFETKQDLSISIRPPQEFVPTYDWQALHSWHTIPSGIETRLPIGYGVRKEARIPEPWRLQLSLPKPCKYFLRMDVYRHSKLSEIRDEASKRCHHLATCFKLYLGGAPVADYDTQTVQSSNLFSEEKELVFDDECLKHSQD